jgi:protein SCO1/2
MRPARVRWALALAALAACVDARPAGAQAQQPPRGLASAVGFDQNLGRPVPLDVPFKDETGAPVLLGDYFRGRPVVLSLVYFRCPRLCGEVLHGEAGALAEVPFEAGKDFEAVTISFDPQDTPADAARQKMSIMAAYGRPGAATGWHFLTGSPEASRAVADAVGFRFAPDPQTGQFAHASGIILLTPDGSVSQYFYGIHYAPTDLRLGLVDASRGAIGGAVDQLLLYCCRYDPGTGRYGMAIVDLIRAGGVLTAILLAWGIGALLAADRRRAGAGR